MGDDDWHPARPAPRPDPVEEALRPLFARVLPEVREAVLSKSPGDWSILCGHLPRITFEIVVDKGPGDPLPVILSYHVPMLVGDFMSSLQASFVLDAAGVARATGFIDRLMVTGPGDMARVLRGCFRSLLHEGLGPELIDGMVRDALADSVMRT
jgi:hypothetical protein